MMRLSEAIRLGAMIRPKATGGYFRNGGSCAIGAALDAMGGKETTEMTLAEVVNGFWPWIYTNVAACPEGCTHTLLMVSRPLDAALVCTVAVHLNDDHGWSRERVADWVEAQEAIHQPTQETEHAEVL